MSQVQVDVTEPLFGARVRNFALSVHDKAACHGGHCPFHLPSEHHMVDWPMIVRLDKHALVERECEHGVGHPDPDSAAYFQRHGIDWPLAHGCDGCCRGDTPAPERG